MKNSLEPDQMPHSVLSDQGLHCLLGPICLKIRVNMLQLRCQGLYNNWKTFCMVIIGGTPIMIMQKSIPRFIRYI